MDIARARRERHEREERQRARIQAEALADVFREAHKITARQPASPTFAEVWPQWTSGSLAEKFPDRELSKGAKEFERDAHRLSVMSLVLGPTPVDCIDLDLADAALAQLDDLRQQHENIEAKREGRKARKVRPAGQNTRRHYAQSVHRVLELCVYPLKLIKHNPLPTGWLPKQAKPKARGFMFPDEDRKLLANTKWPLIERLYFGLLNREGMRPDTEALALRYHEIDAPHGLIRLDTNKTDARREWHAQPGTIEALLAFRKLCAVTEDKARVFDVKSDAQRIAFFDSKSRRRTRKPLGKPAKLLRDALTASGADRPAMHERSEHRIPLRAHDGRATFITLAKTHGWTEDQIMRRTGHTTSEQLANYTRDAENLRELWADEEFDQHLVGDGPTQLLPLCEAIPELRAIVTQKGFHSSVPLRGTNPRKNGQSTGGEIGRRSGFRFHRREA